MKYANIYLVSAILGAFIVFSAVSFVVLDNKISNGSSAQIFDETHKKN